MPLVRRESPTELFKELVESAMEHQHLEATQRTSFYVVNLLAAHVRPPEALAGVIHATLPATG